MIKIEISAVNINQIFRVSFCWILKQNYLTLIKNNLKKILYKSYADKLIQI